MPRSSTGSRDKVLLKMLKTPPKPHGSDDDLDKLAQHIRSGSDDIAKIARLSGQSDPNEDSGKKPKRAK